MKTERIRGKIPAVTIVVCSLLIGTFSYTLDAVANDDPMYELTVAVVGEYGTVEPNSGSYSAGTVVTLTATPEPDYYMRQWTGTDDDTSCALTNTVTMDSDKTVTVEFGQRHVFFVVGGEPNYTSIQYAIDAAGCGDVIILNAGVYFEDINFNGKNIIVTSTNPDDPYVVASTIIQGTGAGPVMTFSGSESQSCRLLGLTITGGNTAGDGGGICGNGTEATITNCVITDNHADGHGGGVSNCNGTIERCTITGNTAGIGGGIYTANGSPTITNCAFVANRAQYGAGMYNEYGSATIHNCVFSNNKAGHSGGGMRNDHSSPTLVNCSITDNVVDGSGGGINNYESSPILVNCAIVGNYAYFYAGGIKNNRSNLTLTNCTIAANTTTGNGAGLWNSGEGYSTVDNCIFWNNAPQEIYNGIGTLIVSYSCVRDGWPGIGNINADPLFVDPDIGNYYLLFGSPCIDAGDNSAVPPSVLTDLDGNPRIRGNAVDMGAYESLYYHVDGVNGDNTNDGFTRETAFATIQYAIDEANDCETVLVWPGVYNEAATHGINFKGKAITVKSAADAAVLEVPGFTAVTFIQGEDRNSVFSNFVVRGSTTGIFALFANPTINNVTVVGNDNGIIADNANPLITNCIFWNNTNGDLFGSPDPITAQYSFVPEVLSEPIAHWKFDDGSGSTATDSAGTNNGTLIGDPTWTAGQIGGALSFDGDGDYVEFASIAALQGDNLTALTWVRVDESAGVWNPVLMQHDLNNNGYYFYIVNDNPSFYIVNGAVFVQVVSTETINADKWYHVAGTNDGSNLKLYVDGRLKGSGSSAGMTGVNYDAYIGCDPVPPLYYIGLIDDVRIYDRALSAGEIETIYEAGLAGISYGGPGFVDANGGDYHLLSERGRYRATTDEWILDEVTSPCVDGGDPNVKPSNERMPNGGRINMGAYGNTAYASMSEWPVKGDINNDGRFNFMDIALLLDSWLEELPWAQ